MTSTDAVLGTYNVTAYVDGKPHSGGPRTITLQPHEDIQLDIGTPVVRPQPVDWAKSQL